MLQAYASAHLFCWLQLSSLEQTCASIQDFSSFKVIPPGVHVRPGRSPCRTMFRRGFNLHALQLQCLRVVRFGHLWNTWLAQCGIASC